MRAKWLYRLESRNPNNGLWYDARGRYVFGVGKMKRYRNKGLPMGYDPRYHVDGKNWVSSTGDKRTFLKWFNPDEIRQLLGMGFWFGRYLARDYIEYGTETVFLKETAIRREELDVDMTFKTRRRK